MVPVVPGLVGSMWTGGPRSRKTSPFLTSWVPTDSNNVSSDATATGPTTQASYASYFVSVVSDSEDLHLLNDSNVLWGSYGADLLSDPNLPVTAGIDGDVRPA